jgi:hypothetical protein
VFGKGSPDCSSLSVSVTSLPVCMCWNHPLQKRQKASNLTRLVPHIVLQSLKSIWSEALQNGVVSMGTKLWKDYTFKCIPVQEVIKQQEETWSATYPLLRE